MPSYTRPYLVQAVLGVNYGANPDGTYPDLQQYIDAAHVTVLRVETCARNKGKPLTPEELELVERWLSAHCYCVMDPLYTSRSTAGRSGSFQRKQGEGFESTDYGMQAVRLDYSGCLSGIGRRAVASGRAVGGRLPPCENQ